MFILNAFLFSIFTLGINAQTDVGKSTLKITGSLICTSCDLVKNHGAKAQCSVYGHQLAFKTYRVADGKQNELYQDKGKVYSILKNDASKGLLADKNLGKQFTIQGEIYQTDGVIEVESFQ